MDHDAGTTQIPALLTGPLDGQYLRLRPDKAPIDWDTYALDKLADEPAVGVLIPEPYIVVDIDDADEAEKLTRLVSDKGIKCQIMQTTRGKHFWFAVAEPMKNAVASMTAVGLTADYRSWGKKSQVCVRLSGVWRQWLTTYDWGELDEIPRWLRPLRQNKWHFTDMGDGDGRNSALYEYQCLLAERFSKQEGFEILRLINKYILKEPLPDREIGTICRDEAYPEPLDDGEPVSDPDAPWFGPKGKFLHNVMGDILMQKMAIVSLHDQLYVYKDGRYQPAENAILRRIVEKFPEAKRMNQNEVLNYLNIQRHIEDPKRDEYIINVLNGRLDLKTSELLPHTPEALDFQQVNAKFDPTAFYAPLDNMLMRVFCGDWQLYKLFEELLGYCLIKNCRMQKIFIFFGEGNNGKSTLLRVITAFIGAGNYTTLSLQDLEKNFRPAELENKLVNLGDDIPATTIKDSSMLKSISSGEGVMVERKNKDPFTLRNYATLIYTTNKMPHVNDKSYGFYRRLVLIPLDAKFSMSDPDYDPDIAQKVVSDQARSYLLNMAVRGLRRMLKHGFTISSKVQQAIETYREKSSTTLTWLAENDINPEKLLEKSTKQLYFEFKSWCEEEGVENVPKQRSFTDDIIHRYGFTISEQRREPKTGAHVRYFLKV